MQPTVILRGLCGLLALSLLPGCASIVFPRKQENARNVPDQSAERMAATAEALAHYSMGILESSGGDSKEALRRYEAALARDPDNLTLRTELAVAYFHQNRLPDMFTALDEVLRRDPDNLRALQLKALSLRMLGQHREALEPLRAAAAAEPAESSHYLEIASIHARLKEFDEALAVLEKSLPSVNDRLSVFQALGELYLNQAADLRAAKRQAALPKAPLEVMARALEEFPEDPYLLTQYGDLLILHRKVEQAIDIFARIEALNPDDLMIRQKLAINLAAVGNRDKAITLLEAIAAEQPRKTRILFYLAELYEQDDQTGKALDTLTRIITNQPSVSEAYLKKAYLLITQDRLAEAQDTLEQGEKNNPGDVRIVEMLGYAHAGQTNFAEASACFARVQDQLAETGRKPLMSNFHLNYAISRQQLDDPEQAAALIRTALEGNPEAVDDYMAIILRDPEQANRLPAALGVLELLQDVIPDTPSSRTLYGLLAFRGDGFATALEQFERAERLSIEEETDEELNAQFFFWTGAAAERIKDYDKAEAYFLKAIQREPDHADSHNYLAYMLAERGVKLDMAYDHVGVALAIEPENAAYLDTRGWIYYRQGKLDEARADIEEALRLMPDDPTIADHLGDILHAQGLTGEAIPWWEKSLALDPDNAQVREKIQRYKTAPEPEPGPAPVSPN